MKKFITVYGFMLLIMTGCGSSKNTSNANNGTSSLDVELREKKQGERFSTTTYTPKEWNSLAKQCAYNQ